MTSENTTKPKGNRCLVCNKKVGLTGFKCRCGGLFCALHRSETEHKCTFDFSGDAQKTLENKSVKLDNGKISAI
tara:strand:+ start:4598 stop:4819 length:222 start_codon:yes stop_codon:yes gene_type:complete